VEDEVSLYPAAVKRLLPENRTQQRITPTQIIVHTAVDAPGPSSLWPFFSRSDVHAESHFFVKNDGTVEQYMDSEVMANANRRADVRAISIETEDDGDPERNPWTAAQLEALVALIRWCGDEHNIPMVQCPAWDRPGVGYHSMWGFADPVAKTGPIRDNPWSVKFAKTCPGRTRTRQFLDVLLPALSPPPPPAAPVSSEDAAMNLIFVPAWNSWYLNGPAGVYRILDVGRLAWWRDVDKLRVVHLDPGSFDVAVRPVLRTGTV